MKEFLITILAAFTMNGCCFQEETAIQEVPRICEEHRTLLIEKVVFYPDRSLLVEPGYGYLEFSRVYKNKFPHATPWAANSRRTQESTDEQKIFYCPRCDDESKRAFESFMKLSESERTRLWREAL